ncbi:DNA polymerase III subunit beta [Oceanithermus sp.]|uniref:DNA polymerase III subunit beta n=1 Tax=Oceanithermus sp. TaxID=2268145 RepID=UPI0025DC6781|nr:DNA polymerase III subunit beta [Oceanithermus sp.]
MVAVLERPQEEAHATTEVATNTMKVDAKELKRALGRLARVVPNRANELARLHVALTPSDGALVLAASDGESDLELTVAAEAKAGPTRLVPAALFQQVAGAIAADTVSLTVVGDVMKVAAGGFKTEIYLMEEGEELPRDFTGEHLLTAPAGEIASVLKPVIYAVSNEQYRAIFRGAQLEVYPDRLRAVATDGFRLAIMDRDLPEGARVTIPQPEDEDTEDTEDADAPAAPRESLAFVVPKRSLIELLRNLPEDGDPVELRFRRGRLVVASERMRFSTSLLEGVYPDYERPIPNEYVATAEVRVEPLREALRRTLVLADAANARVDLTFEEGRVRLASAGDYGRGEEVVELVAYRGEPITVVLNGHYLDEALQPLEGAARLDISGPQSPILIEGPFDPGYRAVVVPMRV